MSALMTKYVDLLSAELQKTQEMRTSVWGLRRWRCLFLVQMERPGRSLDMKPESHPPASSWGYKLVAEGGHEAARVQNRRLGAAD